MQSARLVGGRMQANRKSIVVIRRYHKLALYFCQFAKVKPSLDRVPSSHNFQTLFRRSPISTNAGKTGGGHPPLEEVFFSCGAGKTQDGPLSCEQPRLLFCNLYGSRAFLVVVRHVIYTGAHWIASHQPGTSESSLCPSPIRF